MLATSASPATAANEASPRVPRLPTGPLIVATDAGSDSDAAIVAAQLLGVHTGAPARLVSVVPIVVPSLDAGLAPPSVDVGPPRRAAVRAAIHDQLRRLLPATVDWPVYVMDGEVAPVLARTAHELDAQLIILGRGRHSMIDRLLSGETVLRVLQLADAPVLAVEPGMTALPRRVMIATDFSLDSTYAARVALRLADPDAVLYLVHVEPRTDPFLPGFELQSERDARVRAEFERLRGELDVGRRKVETVTLTGKPGRALVDYAAGANIDLVVSGTHGTGFFHRLVLGSVATRLVRGAPCSVLTVPASAAVRAAVRRYAAAGRTRSLPASEWPRELADFSRRNLGRQCTLEIDDQLLGAQLQGNAVPLIGASFDEHGTQVQIMFGAQGLAGRHLTHVVPRVQEIDLLVGADGRDRAMRLANEGGYTLVSFLD